jgi:hypothetical protein
MPEENPTTAQARARELEEIDKELAALNKKPAQTSSNKTGTTETGKAQWTPEIATKMSAGIFLFGILLFVMISVLVWKNKSVDSLLRTFGILLIIVASVFLVIAGYSDQQIAPVMGLLGTIAGYLLSRKTEPLEKAEAPARANPTAAPKPNDSETEPPVA